MHRLHTAYVARNHRKNPQVLRNEVSPSCPCPESVGPLSAVASSAVLVLLSAVW